MDCISFNSIATGCNSFGENDKPRLVLYMASEEMCKCDTPTPDNQDWINGKILELVCLLTEFADSVQVRWRDYPPFSLTYHLQHHSDMTSQRGSSCLLRGLLLFVMVAIGAIWG